MCTPTTRPLPRRPTLRRYLATLLALLLTTAPAAAEGWPGGLFGGDQSESSRGLARVPAGQTRHALVIGNGAYPSAQLKNPTRDATDMAAKLETLGFQVTRLLDADQRSMEDAVRAFTRTLAAPGSVGLFYFAGHGLEVDGENYLIPVDAEIASESDVRYEALAAGRLLDGMRRAENGLNLVILDACRNNPYSRGFRDASQGLGDMQPAKGTLILYATEPGQVAADGDGRNGPFTAALLGAIDRPGMPVELVFKQAALEVSQRTDGRQTPWQEGVILGEFYFRPPPPNSAPAQAPTTARPEPASTPDPAAVERALELTRAERRDVQQALNTLGHPTGTADGVWGQRTRDAITAWQRSAGLAPSGHLDGPGYKALLAAAAEAGPQPGRTFRDPLRDGGEGPEMVVVPAGRFRMGSNDGHDDEKPVHWVRISRAFAIGTTEVTFADYDRFARATGRALPSDRGWGRDRRPVIHVSWDDANAYAEWLSAQTGAEYRLPSEAEWEYAARAGTTTAYWWGDKARRDRANYGTDDNLGGHAEGADRWESTAPVGSFPANAFGLHDTAGNVWEWVEDWYGDYPSGEVTDPVVRQGGFSRADRGGSWYNSPDFLRSAYRNHSTPGGSYDLGFRLARTL